MVNCVVIAEKMKMKKGCCWGSLTCLLLLYKTWWGWGQAWRRWHVWAFKWCVKVFFFFSPQLWPYLYNSCLPLILLTAGIIFVCHWKPKEKEDFSVFILPNSIWSNWSNGSNIIVVCGLNRNNTFHTGKKKKRTVRFLPPERLPSPSCQNKTEPEQFERGGVIEGRSDGRRERSWDLRFPLVLMLMPQFVLFPFFAGCCCSFFKGYKDVIGSKTSLAFSVLPLKD